MTGYDGSGGMAVGTAGSLDEQLVTLAFFQGDGYVVFCHIALSFLEGVGGEVAKHFQFIFRSAHDGTQSNGDGQPYHACSGNAHAHGVLQNVGRKVSFYVFGTLAQQLG